MLILLITIYGEFNTGPKRWVFLFSSVQVKVCNSSRPSLFFLWLVFVLHHAFKTVLCFHVLLTQRMTFLFHFFPLEFMIAFVFFLFFLPVVIHVLQKYPKYGAVFILFYFIGLAKHHMRCECQNNQDLKLLPFGALAVSSLPFLASWQLFFLLLSAVPFLNSLPMESRSKGVCLCVCGGVCGYVCGGGCGCVCVVMVAAVWFYLYLFAFADNIFKIHSYI